MNEKLIAFLKNGELNDLANIIQKIPKASEKDEKAILHVLEDVTNLQARANLLMYPQLIPEKERYKILLDGLMEVKHTYFVLAALVGIECIPQSAFFEPLGLKIIDEIWRILHQYQGVIAERASTFIADTLWHVDHTIAPRVMQLLGHQSNIVQHNALVALIPLLGLVNIKNEIGAAVGRGDLNQQAQITALKKLNTIKGFSDDTLDEETFDIGILGVSLLPYIPNMDDYEHP
ncbi:MAG: hypothetical protein AAF600_20440 [Bacteroidota bacterium]